MDQCSGTTIHNNKNIQEHQNKSSISSVKHISSQKHIQTGQQGRTTSNNNNNNYNKIWNNKQDQLIPEIKQAQLRSQQTWVQKGTIRSK